MADNFDFKNVKPFLAKLMEKHGLDTEMWKREMNELPDEERQMTFSFDAGDVKNAAVFKFNFMITDVELILDPELKEQILKMIESGEMDL